jgi:TRAP-type C4-dicarboxylate transport system permease small subunit
MRAVDVLVRFAAGMALAAASVAMLMQVVARFVFDAPFSWAEEFAVLVFAWVTFLGAAAVQRDDSHLSIDTLRTRLPARGQRWLDALRRLVIVACGVVLVWQGVILSQKMWGLEFPAMEVSRSLLYLSVPVGFAFSVVLALRSLVTGAPPRSIAEGGEEGEQPGEGSGA